MTAQERPVDWSSYARQYDLMAEINPPYQELLRHCLETVRTWPLEAGDVLADVGAGTGNFSLELATALPDVTVLHLDADEGMLACATEKAKALALENWQPIQVDLNAEAPALPDLAGFITVHSLYAMKEPGRVIAELCSALKPGGRVYACDLGRPLNVNAWAMYLVRESLRTRGLWRTCHLLAKTGIIRKENRKIESAKRKGLFWNHSLEEFVAHFEREGLSIEFASDEFYRGCDDLVIGSKMASV